jgi:peptide chain release factor 2
MKESQGKIKNIQDKISALFDPAEIQKKEAAIVRLEKKSTAAAFWQDNQKASKVMQELADLQAEIDDFKQIKLELQELEALWEILSQEKHSVKEERELDKKTLVLEKKLAGWEFQKSFSGQYDKNDAIISIYSGAGGVDAQDWSAMLLRMYLRFCEKHNFKTKLDEKTEGQEAGIKSATLEIYGQYAYGNLRGESGVHRLVRLSPFNSNNLRQTSFALVEVMPVIEEIKEVVIDPKDLRVDVFRSSGPGGQGVNTTDSAVRITYLPTGLQVACQNERSQLQNKESAMKLLKAKLHKIYLENLESQKDQLRQKSVAVEWGSQSRSYILHPYKLVKDHRTKLETSDAEGVLEGNLDEFIQAYLKNNQNKV